MKFIYIIFLISLFVSCKPKHSENSSENQEEVSVVTDSLIYSGESNFTNIHQLTRGGDNAEAYWGFGSEKIVFQSNYEKWGVGCDQIFVTDKYTELADVPPARISTGLGRTTCAYFLPGDTTIVYSSTHLKNDACPEEPGHTPGGKYLWPIYASYDIFVADLEGNIIRQLTDTEGYDAEPTVSPNGDKIVFTSTRSGDLELWTMNIDGSDQKQITHLPGYDGGAFFSPDGTKLVFRASRPQGEQLKEYKELLLKGLVAPTNMEIFTCNLDGSDLKQITNLGKANWAPFYHPSGEKIIFSSNHHGSRGFQFNLFMINTDGTGLNQITFDPVFDSFPMFSPDGKHLIFSSNRNNNGTHDTNVFVVDWVD